MFKKLFKQPLKQIRSNWVPKQQLSTIYMRQMYDKWSSDSTSVDAVWDEYFKSGGVPSQQSGFSSSTSQESEKILTGLFLLIKSYQRRGCEIADIDPLKLDAAAAQQSGVKSNSTWELDYTKYGLTEQDIDREIIINKNSSVPLLDIAFFLNTKTNWTIREILEKLKVIYCGKVGFQFSHKTNPMQKRWLRQEIESTTRFAQPSNKQKMKIFERLCRNECFTNFLKGKWTTSKRFGVEGCDTLISGLGALIDRAASKKVDNIIFGMPHRGRLNTLACVFWKPYEEIFCEFSDLKYNLETAEQEQGEWGNSGDVKYHLGVTHDKYYPELDHSIKLSIPPNPSHLETVNPVLYGKTRCIQDFEKDVEQLKTVGVLMHGDAAFAGQGVVYESLQFQSLKDYSVGGIIHIVINNQIGFTTTPKDARSGLYSTDIAKCIDAPIFHVNADEPEQVQAVMELAFDYRNQFKQDVVIDLIGYRRFGHNELDQPSFTQPLMYKQIDKMVNVYEKYSQELIAQGVLTQEQKLAEEQSQLKVLQESFDKSREQNLEEQDWTHYKWEQPSEVKIDEKTPLGQGINLDYFRQLAKQIIDIPADFTLDNQLKKIYKARQVSIDTGVGIDYGTAESLAFTSLLQEGYGIRLSGQDVERGTFSHRHAILHDQKVLGKYCPIKSTLPEDQQFKFMISNSHLSEYGVLGFEYGYSMTNPNVLVMWEAQFGDFANGAQAMIDNYIASAETKWSLQSGITMLLPHGMDGQGPEHSSARMERFLQLTDDDEQILHNCHSTQLKQQNVNSNMQIVQCSTSANYFLALRRQMRRNFRKPLICFNSKKLLRFKRACSNIEEFQSNVIFNRVYGEKYPLVADDQVKKVIICSGQVYYDLLEQREKLQVNDTALIRIEQISPFPYLHLRKVIENYKNAKFIFCQEEHQNYGPWIFVSPRIDALLEELYKDGLINSLQMIQYVGRRYSGSPAAGSMKVHKLQLQEVLDKAYSI